MRNLLENVLYRYAGDVVPFGKPRPKVPQATIQGRKYNLSTHSGDIAGDLEDLAAPDTGAGARIIRLPPGANKWKYLWVYDTDRKTLTMWRVSDGDEKYHSVASNTSLIVSLDKKGQLNRVDHQGFAFVDKAMRKLYADNLKALQDYWEREKGDWQRVVDQEVREYYERFVEPKVEDAVVSVRSGVIPLGFKAYRPEDKERQMVVHVVTKILMSDLTEDKLLSYLEKKGLDPEAPGKDIQAVQWAIDDMKDSVVRSYI